MTEESIRLDIEGITTPEGQTIPTVDGLRRVVEQLDRILNTRISRVTAESGARDAELEKTLRAEMDTSLAGVLEKMEGLLGSLQRQVKENEDSLFAESQKQIQGMKDTIGELHTLLTNLVIVVREATEQINRLAEKIDGLKNGISILELEMLDLRAAHR